MAQNNDSAKKTPWVMVCFILLIISLIILSVQLAQENERVELEKEFIDCLNAHMNHCADYSESDRDACFDQALLNCREALGGSPS